MYRKEKMEHIIQERLALHIAREVEDELSALITVTHVSIDSRNEEAIVFISVLPEEKETQVLTVLEKKKGYLAFKVLKEMKVRVLPFISFRVDSEAKKLHN